MMLAMRHLRPFLELRYHTQPRMPKSSSLQVAYAIRTIRVAEYDSEVRKIAEGGAWLTPSHAMHILL